MEYDQFIRNEIRKGIDLLDYEILTYQHGDKNTIHYFSESTILSGGKILVRSDIPGDISTPDKLKISRIKLEVKLAAIDALLWEEYENCHYQGYTYYGHSMYTVRFPFRDVYHNDPYFLEDRRVYDDLFDLFFPEREENSYERLVIRNDVLTVLRNMRTLQ